MSRRNVHACNRSNPQFRNAAPAPKDAAEALGRFVQSHGSAHNRKKLILSDTALPHFQATLFATALEDAIYKLRALSDSNSESRIQKVLIEIQANIKKKYGIEQHSGEDEFELLADVDVHADKFKFSKMDDDRSLCTGILVSAYKELVSDQNYAHLLKTIARLGELKRKHAAITRDHDKNKIGLKDLHKLARQQTITYKNTMYDLDACIDGLGKKIEDADLTGDTKLRLVENWEQARREQHDLKTELKSKPTMQSLQYYRDMMSKEHTVHNEVGNLFNAIIASTLQEVEKWMTKYDDDIEAIDLSIQKQRLLYQDTLEKRVYLEEQFALHKKQIVDWETFKENRAIEQKYAADMTRCAIAVQAWWRGMMVRQQLGLFKVKKKRGGGKKKKK